MTPAMAAPRILNRRWATSLCVAVLAQCLLPCGTVKARSSHVSKKGERKSAKTGPEAIKKVMELISDLMVQIDRDAASDGEGFKEYNVWYQNISMNTKRVIDETSQQIDSLKAGLEEQDAFRDGAQRDLEEAGGKRGAAEKELADATATRKKERKEFEKTEATLSEGVDQLERALVVLGKQMAPQTGASSASLLTVAEGLRKTLESGPDFHLSAGQRQTLHAFMRAANAKAHRQEDSAEPDFLQLRQEQGQTAPPADYGEYDSQGGGVVETLESVLDKTKAQLDSARSEETKAMDTFKSFEADLKAEIKNLKRTMAELNTQLSQSQQSSGQMQSQLIAATELLKVSQDQLKEIEAGFKEKNRNYKERMNKRSDELMALTEAKQILSSDAMSQAMDESAAQPAPPLPEKADAAAPDFLQMPRIPALYARGHELARRAAALAAGPRKQPSEDAAPALSLLSLRSRSRTKEADPFDKVKDMISSMLAKLQDHQNEEVKHKEWCDREMSKSTQSKKEKEDNIRKLTDRIAAMDAELAQVTDDIKVVTEDLAEMSASIKSATELRTAEHDAASTAVTQSKDAQRLIKAAIKVLKRVYKDAEKEEAASPTPAKEEAGSSDLQNTGWGAGVIGILEVALQDYSDLESEVSMQESVSDREYKEMMDQNEIRQATFSKDLEYKGRAKVKLEGDRMRASTDLKAYQKELEAVETYLKELQSSCVAKPSSYEERADRRESELKSLKEALDFLNGEGMA